MTTNQLSEWIDFAVTCYLNRPGARGRPARDASRVVARGRRRMVEVRSRARLLATYELVGRAREPLLRDAGR